MAARIEGVDGGSHSASESVATWLEEFQSKLEKGDSRAVAVLFCENECFWRDIVAFTWNIKTLSGKSEIEQMLDAQVASGKTQSMKWKVESVSNDPSIGADDVSKGEQIEAKLSFETLAFRCEGHVRLRKEPGDGNKYKCWTLLTSAKDMKKETTETASSSSSREYVALDDEYFVVVVGGGHCGTMLGAHLQRMGVRYIILDANKNPGDSWRKRYKSARLQDPLHACQFPYLSFPDGFPRYLPVNMLADWMQDYVLRMGLNYCTESWCQSVEYDDDGKFANIVVQRNGENFKLRTKHVVFATGSNRVPRFPTALCASKSEFQGIIMHSTEYSDGEKFHGKRVCVVGSNSTGHDICKDMWEYGASEVTMVQRSPTSVYSLPALEETILKGYLSPEIIESTDFGLKSIPFTLLEREQRKAVYEMRRIDANLRDSLEKVGFHVDDGPDDTGVVFKFLRDGFGFYYDLGASELLAEKKVKVASGSASRFLPQGVLVTKRDCTTGVTTDTVVPADVVILATGFTTSMACSDSSNSILPRHISDKLGREWGLGSGLTPNDPGPYHGELYNQWKPTPQEGLWLMGGNFSLARMYSKVLALQLKARQDGLDTPVYF